VRLFDSIVTTDIGKPYWMTFTMDGAVLAFLAAVCAGTGIVFGLAPALHVSKSDVHEVLKDAGGRSGTSGSRARRWTSALIVMELALTLVLLAGAGFMMRSFLVMYQMNIGVDTSHLLTMRLFLPLGRYPTPEGRTALYQQIEQRLKGISGIRATALTSNGPMQGGLLRQLSVNGRPAPPGERLPEVTMVSISPSYFTTLGVPVVRGRTLEDSDGTPGHENALVNQRFVSMHFSTEDPIGQRITLIDGVPSAQPSAPASATIVGVVPTVRQRSFQDPDPDPVVYLPYRADPQRNALLIVRTAGDPGGVTALVREQMRAIEPDLPLFQIRTMDQLLALQRWSYRVFGSMFAIFAVIALALSAVGLYAVTAYSVTQRTAEIGVRMALGAQPPQVLWLVLRRALVQLAIGLPIGIAGAFGVGRLLQTLLFQAGTSGRDPVTIVSIAALMIVVSINACFWPARRAIRLDPVTALRYE
jgi:putative ABC transport system permease protein